jgi:hypothetical protein
LRAFEAGGRVVLEGHCGKQPYLEDAIGLYGLEADPSVGYCRQCAAYVRNSGSVAN